MRALFELNVKGQGKGHYTSGQRSRVVERPPCRTAGYQAGTSKIEELARLKIYPSKGRSMGHYSDRRGPELAKRHCLRHGPQGLSERSTDQSISQASFAHTCSKEQHWRRRTMFPDEQLSSPRRGSWRDVEPHGEASGTAECPNTLLVRMFWVTNFSGYSVSWRLTL
jgi:hypothetical protein